MVPPRQSKADPTSPDDIAVAGGSSGSVDRFYDLSLKVAGIERSITYLEGHAETADKKLDSITTDIVGAKATFGTLKWLFTATVVGVWGIALALLTEWAKHYFGW